MTDEHQTPEITDNPDAGRYEARLADGRLAGFAEYRREPGVITFHHTKVKDEFEGQGVGGALARAALERARAEGLTVRPVCPFVSGWIDRHPEYRELVAEPS